MDGITYEEITNTVTEIGWDILSILSKIEQIKIKELQGKLKLAYPKFTNELNRLDGAKLIQYSKSNTDKRTIFISISNHGLKIFNYRK